ncbi:Cytosolic iron-sulfur protein assembly protein 1 [Nosema bombycis CQ1]|uniref:Cytosolic iron-sulfur protein assembly protein 1 n=1 Tax=Nosema bombycis (strain CQ1 / CVCC 102059) TaxID=578461 RepID=R0M7T9_NOSB1|nr:Cytosolic iron-sulfur protein assembly protein 1 [Nosema bombycis CQ1]|eukprot:EOB14059.1 Cytosolic iron-sulfur protein assembly protein 1 [Nosema bombycis CQ1]
MKTDKNSNDFNKGDFNKGDFKISKFKTDKKLRAILVSNSNIYTGGSSGCLVDRTNNKILHKHDKSITSIKSYQDNDLVIGCTSYDCTASIIKNNSLFDIIEGPDTEIKGISINQDFIALSTRGKTVWLCKFGDFIEIDKILEDHTEDVKGCEFYNNFLFTYGYDSTIKIYEYFEFSGSYELVQDIFCGSTIWDLKIRNFIIFVGTDNGEIIVYDLEKGFVENIRKKLGIEPIYSLCIYKNLIVTGVNGGNLVFLDLNLEIVKIIKGVHNGDINCISYSEKDEILVTCGDDQVYCVLEEVK